MRSHNVTLSFLLLSVIENVVKSEGVSRDCLSTAVVELSRLFTRGRSALSHSYLESPTLATAYLNYFLPVNLSKIQVLLDEMPVVLADEPFSVLDLGSGPGTGALAVLDWWHGRGSISGLSVVAVDRSMTALHQAESLWSKYCRTANLTGASLQTCKADVGRTGWVKEVESRVPFDLIILANCLNEIHADATDPIAMRSSLVTELLARLAPQGTLMIVEPALRETSRALHQVRDQLLQEKRCTVYSPCLHEQYCPALAKPDDWCHEERPWEPPVSIQEIDEAVGFIKDALKFSYLLLRKDGKTIVYRRPDVYRVVSELRHLKGEKRAWLCNEQGREEVGRQDRLVSPANAAFDNWHRGAIVQIERIAHKEKAGKVSALGRIKGDTKVQMVRSV
ncbi:MAG: methyltransferase domain-containing protein [Nitrospira sp.]|nr:MAG: methyltransferase domain-containing protein [Nitrospira sp.]